MASCFDSGIYDTPYLNGVPYNARINGGKKVWSDEVSDYPPVYYDTRDLLMLINSGTNGEVDEDLNPVAGEFIIPFSAAYASRSIGRCPAIACDIYVYPLSRPGQIQTASFSYAEGYNTSLSDNGNGIKLSTVGINLAPNTNYVIGVRPSNNDYTSNWLAGFGFYLSYSSGCDTLDNKRKVLRVYNCCLIATRPLTDSLAQCGFTTYNRCSRMTRFADCTESIALDMYSTRIAGNNVAFMCQTFLECTALAVVTLPEFTMLDTTSVTIDGNVFYRTFYYCTALTEGPEVKLEQTNYYVHALGSNFMCEMYRAAGIVVAKDDPEFRLFRTNSIGTNYMREMYRGCASLTTPGAETPSLLETNNFCSSVGAYYMYGKFMNCTYLTESAEETHWSLWASVGNYFRGLQYYGCNSLKKIGKLRDKAYNNFLNSIYYRYRQFWNIAGFNYDYPLPYAFNQYLSYKTSSSNTNLVEAFASNTSSTDQSSGTVSIYTDSGETTYIPLDQFTPGATGYDYVAGSGLFQNRVGLDNYSQLNSQFK